MEKMYRLPVHKHSLLFGMLALIYRSKRILHVIETECPAHNVHLIADGLINVAAFLENAQTETRQDSQQMFQDVRLDFFKLDPSYFLGKTINFKRHAGLGGGQFPNHQRHIVANNRILFQIALRIDSECTEIGEITGVEAGTTGVVCGDLRLRYRQRYG